MEAVLNFDDKDFEAQNGLEHDKTAVSDSNYTEDGGPNSAPDTDPKLSELIEKEQFSEEEKFESKVLQVDEEWRDIYRESRYYPDEFLQEVYEPNQPWNKWQETKDYSIKVS